MTRPAALRLAATLGMDVHAGLKLSRGRLQETADFLHDFLGRLNASRQRGQELPGLSRPAPAPASIWSPTIPGVHQARHVRARSQARVRRMASTCGCRADRPGRRLEALFAGGDASLCAALAPVPHAERRVPCGAYPSRRPARCSTSCSRPGPGSTAARSIRPRKRMRSSPTMSSPRPRRHRQTRGGSARGR